MTDAEFEHLSRPADYITPVELDRLILVGLHISNGIFFYLTSAIKSAIVIAVCQSKTRSTTDECLMIYHVEALLSICKGFHAVAPVVHGGILST